MNDNDKFMERRRAYFARIEAEKVERLAKKLPSKMFRWMFDVDYSPWDAEGKPQKE